MMIPTQLKNNKFRFCILGQGGTQNAKMPIEKKWNTLNNYEHDSPKLLKHLKQGNNYAVITHFGSLLVIDFDQEFYQKALIDMMPNTFTVKTGGKGLYHLYYLIDKPFKKFCVRNEHGVVADFLCLKSACVGPGCTHESGGVYEVVKDVPITRIKVETLKYILGDNFPERKVQLSRFIRTRNDLPDMIREVVSPSMVLMAIGADTTRNPCECPLHATSGGHNLSYNNTKGVMHCFNCDFGGNIFHLWMKKYNLGFRETVIQIYKVFNVYTKHLNTSYDKYIIQGGNK